MEPVIRVWTDYNQHTRHRHYVFKSDLRPEARRQNKPLEQFLGVLITIRTLAVSFVLGSILENTVQSPSICQCINGFSLMLSVLTCCRAHKFSRIIAKPRGYSGHLFHQHVSISRISNRASHMEIPSYFSNSFADRALEPHNWDELWRQVRGLTHLLALATDLTK